MFFFLLYHHHHQQYHHCHCYFYTIVLLLAVIFLKHIIIVTVLLLLLLLSHIFCDKPIWLDLGWHVSFLFFVPFFTESLILCFPNLGNSQLFGGMYRGMLALDDLIFVYR
jgi:hypothetical protein